MRALNPAEGLIYLFQSKKEGLIVLGSVFLCVTGLEALYADMGHFTKQSVRLSWTLLVFPSLLLNYLGQGALLIRNRSAASDPFFGCCPSSLYWLCWVEATIATVIASQAMITACYSLISQAISLNYAPPFEIKVKKNKNKTICCFAEQNNRLSCSYSSLLM